MIAAVGIGRFHRRHHAIGHRAGGAREGQRRLVHHLIAEQRVALHLVVDVADLAAEVERRPRVAAAVEAGAVVLRAVIVLAVAASSTMPNCRRSTFGSFFSISMISAGGVPFLISL